MYCGSTIVLVGWDGSANLMLRGRLREIDFLHLFHTAYTVYCTIVVSPLLSYFSCAFRVF